MENLAALGVRTHECDIWYTLVRQVATMLKEDLIGGNCPSYLLFSH